MTVKKSHLTALWQYLVLPEVYMSVDTLPQPKSKDCPYGYSPWGSLEVCLKAKLNATHAATHFPKWSAGQNRKHLTPWTSGSTLSMSGPAST